MRARQVIGMVGRGEVLERMTLVSSSGVVLEGLAQRGEPGALPVVLAPPHPRLGGSMDTAVLSELVWTLARAGHATLRFNFRGVAGSQGRCTLPPLDDDEPWPSSVLAAEVADLEAAIDHHVAGTADRRCIVIGHSLGAAVAADAALQRSSIVDLVLVAPPVHRATIDFASLRRSGRRVMVICGDADPHAPLAHIEAALDATNATARDLPPIPLFVVPGAGHFFTSGLRELARLVSSWLGDRPAAEQTWAP